MNDLLLIVSFKAGTAGAFLGLHALVARHVSKAWQNQLMRVATALPICFALVLANQAGAIRSDAVMAGVIFISFWIGYALSGMLDRLSRRLILRRPLADRPEELRRQGSS